MAYSNFSYTDLEEKFGIKFKEKILFSNFKKIKPSKWLIAALQRLKKLGIGNEKSRSERIITPILAEVASLNENLLNESLFAIISGVNLDVDVSLGLNGECDFMFALGGSQELMSPPIFCIAEAKRQDLEAGIIQASAQVVGARIYNEKKKFPLETLYGATTTGEVWRFLKYEKNEITFDKNRYFIDNLSKLLGVLQNIVEISAKSVFSK